jgi:hypothetical protein
MKTLANFGPDAPGRSRRLAPRQTKIASKMGNVGLEAVWQEFFLRREMKLTVLCLFAALTAGARSTTQHLPLTDAEKIADALRAGPHFKTDDATILDWPTKKGGEFRVLRKGTCVDLPAGSTTRRHA